MNLAATTGDVCTGPNGDLISNCYRGDSFQGIAAGMWSTMPEWARVGLCVIIAALLISLIMKFFAAVFSRIIGVVVVIALVVYFHALVPDAYNWFRHLPFVNGTL